MRLLPTDVILMGGMILACGAAAVAPAAPAAAAEAGEAVETIQSECHPIEGEGARDSLAERQPLLSCVAIYRNRSNRPVFDIGFEVRVGGRTAATVARDCCDKGTRQALRPNESALLWVTVAVPEGVAGNAPVSFAYHGAWTGDERALDVPRPQLQYVDRAEEPYHVRLVGEVRNVDRRAWVWDPAVGSGPPYPLLALFRRGKLVGAGMAGNRWPFDRIGPEGRYVFEATVSKGNDFDTVQAFFLDAFLDVDSNVTDAQLQLSGLDHWTEADSRGNPWVMFRAAVRNPSSMRTQGPVFAIARRADYHAIGVGTCRDPIELLPGEQASCTGAIRFFDARAAGEDAIAFLTVELGGAVAFLPTPTPIVTVTPCPALATPAPVPTLSSVARTLYFPWSIRMLAERCP